MGIEAVTSGKPVRRRELLVAGATASAGLAMAAGAGPLNYAAIARKRKIPLAKAGSFSQGIASGFPFPNAITLWTRLDKIGGNAHVKLEVAKDKGFKRVVQQRNVKVLKSTDHTGKAHVEGLKAGTEYFYRFETKDKSSPIGTFRTGPPPDSQQPIRIAVLSCQNWNAGFFNAQRAIANEDVDLVLHLGDYIYESDYYTGGPRTDTTGVNNDGDVQTLAEYREKYHLYKSDPDLRAMHLAHPFVSIWDDHEVEGNYAGDDPSSHAAPGETNDEHPRRVLFPERQVNGYQAFFEYMPRWNYLGDKNRIFEYVRLGAMVDLILTDERQYRDQQPCNDQILVPCPDSGNPGRTMLGANQKAWLKDRLINSPQNWKLWASEVMLMAVELVADDGGVNQDAWDGYTAERAELMNYILANDIENVAILTGDIHTFFAGKATTTGNNSGTPAAPEFVGGSATSLGLPEATGFPAAALGAIAAAQDQHVSFYDFEKRGYMIIEAKPDELTCEFKSVDALTQGAGAPASLAKFRVDPGDRTPTQTA